jgi:3-oxoacyl-(acyl-carrier-protein) synthase
MGAASDLAEVILGVLGTSRGIVPATPNFGIGDSGSERLSISASPQACNRRRFLSISYGLGGQSVSVVVAVPRAESV